MKQLDSEFGWATLDCGRIRLQYSDKNFLGTARRFELTGQASKIGFGEPLKTRGTQDLCSTLSGGALENDRQFSERLHYYLGASLRQPRLLGTRWVPVTTVYSERRGEYKAYLRSTQIGGDVSATRDVGDRTPLRLGYSIEYGRTQAPAAAFCALFNRCDADSQKDISELATLGVASAALARFRTDNLVNPSQGTAMRVEARSSASRFLGTSKNLFFNKGTGDVSYYHPLGYRNTVAFRLRGGSVFGRRLPDSSAASTTGFIPPQERLYAGGPTSVRGFQQNELGSSVYIARSGEVRIETTVLSPTDTAFHFEAIGPPDSIAPERAVPLGGNSLFVANIEYRLRDPFFLPDLLQYTLFIDGGDVWNREIRGGKMYWTPGFGIRAVTPVGPVQVNVGYNRYPREAGPLYYNPDVTTLACATPLNLLIYTRDPVTKELKTNGTCGNFIPRPRNRFIQKLTFTFSIGPDF